MVLDTRKRARLRIGQVRLHVIKIEVETDIAVEVPVAWVAWVTLLLAPNLRSGIEVPPKSREPIGREDWREHAIARPRTGKQHAMGIEKEPANSRFLQERVDGRGIGAFGQPDATRVCPETGSIMVARGENLAAQRSGMLGEQR